MARKKNITKNNQLGFMFDRTGALSLIQTVAESKFEKFLKDKRIRLLSNNKEALMAKLRDRYCYRDGDCNEEKSDNIKIVNENDELDLSNLTEDKKAAYDKLRILQNLPLEFKIDRAIRAIEEAISVYGEDNLVIAYSGGWDSQIVSYIVTHIMKKKILHVFSNTTCEFPETLERVRELSEEGVDIVVVSPDISFNQVVKQYGFPMISKNISKSIRIFNRTQSDDTAYKIKDYMERREQKWVPTLDEHCPFSDECCEKLKKFPMRRFQKAFGYECAIVGTMASESRQRTREWLSSGCNAFNGKNPKSMPLSTWTDADKVEFTKMFNLKLNKLYEMGYKRNGCMYCGYGVHLESINGKNRLQMLAETHPIAYKVFLRYFAKYFDMMQDLGYKGFEYKC